MKRTKKKSLPKWLIGVIIGLVVALIVFVVKLIKKNKSKPSDLTEQATNVLQQMGVSTNDMAVLNNKALQIATHLGTNYSWWNPAGWTESDEKVYNLIKDITQTEFDILSKLYFEVHAKGRNLSADLASYLDSKYYELLIIK